MRYNPEEFDIEDIIREFGSGSDGKPESEPVEEIPAEEAPEALFVEEIPAEEGPEALFVEEIPAEELPEEPFVEEIPEEIPEIPIPVEEAPAQEPAQEEYDLEFALDQSLFAQPEPAIFEEDVDTIRLDNVSTLQVQQEDPMEQTKALPSLEELSGESAEEAPAEPEDLGDTQRVPVLEETPEEAPKERRFVLHPQSNPIRELKKQLTVGPERLYYQMAEKGAGKLMAAILANLVVVLLCATVTALQAFGVVGESFLRAVIFGQILAMFLSALLGCFQLIDGAADLIRGRFSLNTLLLFSFLLCIADGILALQELRVPCCAAFCLAMTFSQLATHQKRATLSSRLDSMRKASSLTGIHVLTQEDGRKLFVTGGGQVDDFMDTIHTPSLPEKIQGYYAMGVLGISFLLGVGTVFWDSIAAGVQVWAVSLLLALPVCSFITVSRPLALLERRLHKLGTVLFDWNALKKASGKADYPITFQELFPEGCAKLNGTKFFGSLPPEEVVSYAAALICATESGLTPLFMTLLDNHHGRLYEADDLQAYDRGVGGVVEGVNVLAGSLSFLRQMGVEADESLYISQSICVAIDGELSGMFAITYDKNKAAAAGLQTLSFSSGLRPTVAAADPMITGSFLNKKFGVRQSRFHFPDYPTRQAMRNAMAEEDSKPIAFVTKPGLAPVAYGITGARNAYTAAMLGTLVQFIGGALGLVMMGVLVYIGALELITPVNMFLYQLLWLIPGWLITEWARIL